MVTGNGSDLISEEIGSQLEFGIDEPVSQLVSFEYPPHAGSVTPGSRLLESRFGLSSESARSVLEKVSKVNRSCFLMSSAGLLLVGKLSERAFRLTLLTDGVLLARLAQSNGPISLTPRELHLLKQILTTSTLLEAATADGVGVETKRTQLKAITAKFGVRSQLELVSLVLCSLMMSIERPSDFSVADAASSLLAEFHPYARIHRLMDDDGGTYTYLDHGDLDGTCLVYHASQALYPLHAKQVETLEMQGVRLIVPLRHGCFDLQAKFITTADYTDHAVRAASLGAQIFGAGRAHCIGVMSGGAYAIMQSLRLPETVKSLALFGAYAGERSYQGLIQRFRKAAMGIAIRNPRVNSHIFGLMSREFKDAASTQKYLEALYSGSPPDLEVIAAEFAQPLQKQCLRSAFRYSFASMRQDFAAIHDFDWYAFGRCRHPKLILHGDADSINPIGDAESFSRKVAAKLEVIENCGQLAVGKRFSAVCETWKRWVDQL